MIINISLEWLCFHLQEKIRHDSPAKELGFSSFLHCLFIHPSLIPQVSSYSVPCILSDPGATALRRTAAVSAPRELGGNR